MGGLSGLLIFNSFMTNQEKTDRVFNVLLDKPEVFHIRWIWGLRLKFGIRPLKGGTIQLIAEQAAKIKDADVENAMSVVGLAKCNIKPMCRMIAYSVLGKKRRIRLFGRMLANFLAGHLTPKEIHILLQIIIQQSSAQELFGCTVLIKMIVPATLRAVGSKEGAPSGEKLPG